MSATSIIGSSAARHRACGSRAAFPNRGSSFRLVINQRPVAQPGHQPTIPQTIVVHNLTDERMLDQEYEACVTAPKALTYSLQVQHGKAPLNIP